MPWPEVMQFRGNNTGPEIVTPVIPVACRVPLGEPQECSLAHGKRKQKLWPPTKFPGLCENNMECGFKTITLIMAEMAGYC